MAQPDPSTRGRPDRVTAIRFLSDDVIETRCSALERRLEILTDAGPWGLSPSDDAEIVSIRADLEALAADITAEHPHRSRSLRASAHDLTLALAVDDRRHRYQRLCDGLAGLETL